MKKHYNIENQFALKYNISKDFLIKEYSKNKKSVEKITNELSCSITPIYNRLIKYDIPIRTISEAIKGVKNGSYNPERHRIYYCREQGCNNQISYDAWKYGQGRCGSCARKGKNNPFYGKHFTKASKKKLSLTKGGTGIPREFNTYPEEYFRIRPKILKRDNYICQLCVEYGNEVHHIDYNKENNLENNLIDLCHRCNNKVNYARDYWFAYFTYIMEIKKEVK